jgi:hypothetical protein
MSVDKEAVPNCCLRSLYLFTAYDALGTSVYIYGETCQNMLVIDAINTRSIKSCSKSLMHSH